jgi:hypothetical protein
MVRVRGGWMRGGQQRPLTREDLEAMRKEFALGERHNYSSGTSGSDDALAHSLDDDLHQLRRRARLGVSLEEWARSRSLPLTYARALQRYLEQS